MQNKRTYPAGVHGTLIDGCWFNEEKVRWQEEERSCTSSVPPGARVGQKRLLFLSCRVPFFFSPLLVGLEAREQSAERGREKKWVSGRERAGPAAWHAGAKRGKNCFALVSGSWQ
jgi:hypothetical protein